MASAMRMRARLRSAGVRRRQPANARPHRARPRRRPPRPTPAPRRRLAGARVDERRHGVRRRRRGHRRRNCEQLASLSRVLGHVAIHRVPVGHHSRRAVDVVHKGSQTWPATSDSADTCRDSCRIQSTHCAGSERIRGGEPARRLERRTHASAVDADLDEPGTGRRGRPARRGEPGHHRGAPTATADGPTAPSPRSRALRSGRTPPGAAASRDGGHPDRRGHRPAAARLPPPGDGRHHGWRGTSGRWRPSSPRSTRWTTWSCAPGRSTSWSRWSARTTSASCTCLNDSIRSIPGVRSTETFVYLKLAKQTYTWGTR